MPAAEAESGLRRRTADNPLTASGERAYRGRVETKVAMEMMRAITAMPVAPDGAPGTPVPLRGRFAVPTGGTVILRRHRSD